MVATIVTSHLQNRMKMQEMMIEKLKKEAGATIVEIKDISYDAGYLYGLQQETHNSDWKCLLFLPSFVE